MSVITDRLGNPFEFDKNNEPSKPDPLTNIANGVVASDIISTDLGSELTKLSVPLKKKKLQTCINATARKDKVKRQQTPAESVRDLFSRLLFVSQDWKIYMKTLFEHELSNVLVAIVNSDGSLYEAKKS